MYSESNWHRYRFMTATLMNQVSDILHLAQQARDQQVDAVLATVVRTEGSAYRRAGAMMLICADGRSVGMISGGCLEPHIIKRAFWLTRNGASVQVYQTGDEHTDHDNDDYQDIEETDDELNFGLGCNGRVHVLFERLDKALWLIAMMKQVRETQQPATVATLIRSTNLQHHIGTRVQMSDAVNVAHIADEASHTDAEKINHSYKEWALNAAQQASHYHKNQKPYNNCVTVTDTQKPDVQTEWLVQRIHPQIRLLICGAGNDVVPLVSMAKWQDWHVTVIDSRPQYATASRFPQADAVLCLPLEDTKTLLTLSNNAAVALMSHSLSQDRARLAPLLAHAEQCRYIGQLGPVYRTERLINEIAAAGTIDPTLLAARTDKERGVLHYPIGYKLGGDGPEALALGIMAQISAVVHDMPFQNVATDKRSMHNVSVGHA